MEPSDYQAQEQMRFMLHAKIQGRTFAFARCPACLRSLGLRHGPRHGTHVRPVESLGPLGVWPRMDSRRRRRPVEEGGSGFCPCRWGLGAC